MPHLRRLVVLAVALAALALGGCGGGDKSAESQGQTPAAGAPTRDCEKAPPGHVADGVNDEQGGSRPGTDPCTGE